LAFCHFERSALQELFPSVLMGAESKNPGKTSVTMLLQGVLFHAVSGELLDAVCPGADTC
jgi:hypothetical protein